MTRWTWVARLVPAGLICDDGRRQALVDDIVDTYEAADQGPAAAVLITPLDSGGQRTIGAGDPQALGCEILGRLADAQP